MMGWRWIRKAAWAAGILLLAGLAVPWVTVNFSRQGIAATLSRELGRPVRLGAVHLKLLDGLGFEIENVVVEEDPQFGIEPFARMESLEAGVALRSLRHRRWEFSTLVFVRPSLNFVRNADGRWNSESLGKAAGLAAPGQASPRPANPQTFARGPRIRVQSGRINFKSERQKQVYVFDAVDLDLTPPSSASQPWALRFEGTPSRTDSALRPVSRVQARAEWGPFSSGIQEGTGLPVRLDVSARGALLEDFLRVLLGSDYGIHGVLHLQLHLAGTTSLLRMSGETSLEELHRWDLVSPSGAPALRGRITGLVDPVTDSLELTSLTLPLPQGSVVIQGRIARLSHQPHPELRARFQGVSLATLVEIAQSFTRRLGTRFLGEGTLSGEFQMTGGFPSLAGKLRVADGVLEEKGTRNALRFSDFPVVVQGESGSLGPARVTVGKGSELGFALRWDRRQRAATVHVEGARIPIRPVLEWVRRFGGPETKIRVEQGNLGLRADISMVGGKLPELRGWAEVSDVIINSAAVRAPVRISSARLRFQRDQVLVKAFSAALGEIRLRGSLRAWPFPRAMSAVSAEWEPRFEFDCQVSEIDLAELDRLFDARDRIASVFHFWNREEAPPSFWRKLVARGRIQADAVGYRGVALNHVRASLDFRDRVLEIRKFTGELAGGAQTGTATIQWGSDQPSFRVETRFADLDLHQLSTHAGFGKGLFSGKWSGAVRLAGSGRDRNEILEKLGGAGTVSGHNLELSSRNGMGQVGREKNSVNRMASLSAAFQIAKQEVILTDLRMIPQEVASGEETSEEAPPWRLTGTVGFNGRLNVRVKEPAGAEYAWTGTLAEPRRREVRPEQEQALNSSVPRK